MSFVTNLSSLHFTTSAQRRWDRGRTLTTNSSRVLPKRFKFPSPIGIVRDLALSHPVIDSAWRISRGILSRSEHGRNTSCLRCFSFKALSLSHGIGKTVFPSLWFRRSGTLAWAMNFPSRLSRTNVSIQWYVFLELRTPDLYNLLQLSSRHSICMIQGG